MRKWLLLAVVALLALGAGATSAACAEGDQEEALLRQIVESQGRIEAALKDLKLGLEAQVAGEFAAIPEPPPGHVAIKLAWKYRDMPPGAEILAYEPGPGLKLWDTISYKKGQQVPTGAPIKDAVVFVKPGEEKLVQFVYKNPMPADMKFWVVPHILNPQETQAKVVFKCLCTGAAYDVPAEGSWTRVVSVGVTPDVKPGAKLIATHEAVFGTGTQQR